ncbi:MAG: septum formation initiator family protein [Chloroflexi bacterium]|nr:septum formation initiator family protein [Chloroflexota bacterium]
MQNIRAHFKQILIIASIVVAVFLLLDYQSRLKQLNEIEAQRDIVAANVVELKQTQQALQKQLEYAKSDAMVEEFARVDLNAGQSGDVRVVPIGVGDVTPTPVPTLVTTPAPVEKWEVWLALIFTK